MIIIQSLVQSVGKEPAGARLRMIAKQWVGPKLVAGAWSRAAITRVSYSEKRLSVLRVCGILL